MINRLKGIKGKKVAIIGGVAGAVAAVAIGVVMFMGGESYRTIAVEELNGTTLVSSNNKEAVNAYEGMHLYSGDDVSVQQDADMTMVLDMDKYVYAEPGTHFWLECAGTSDESRTVICMDEGSTLNRLKDTLNAGEVYQVDTPNSTMAVRGTVFRVTVYRGADGMVYTLLEVFEGQVQVDLKTENGEYNGISEIFGPGESALIRGNADLSEFVVSEENEIKKEIEYKQIPQSTAKVLAQYIDDGQSLCIEKELLLDYTKLSEHKLETRIGKEPTCTEPGYQEVWCSVCNEVAENIEVPAAGHTLTKWEVMVEPTCEETGYQQRNCEVCQDAVEKEELSPLGHVEGESEIIAVADCTHNGEQVTYCERCEEVIDRVITDALGHLPDAVTVLKRPSCTAEGSAQTICSRCGIVMETQTLSALGHQMGNWTQTSVADCTHEGVKESVCTLCGYKETQTQAVGGHRMGSWKEVTAATCTVEGMQERICEACGYKETKTLSTSGHEMSEWEEETPPTCTDAGEEVRVCLQCEYSETRQINAAGGHSITSDYIVVEATCEKSGGIQGICEYCLEEVFIPDEANPALDHAYYYEHTNLERNDRTVDCVKNCERNSEDMPCGCTIHTVVGAAWLPDDEGLYPDAMGICGNCNGPIMPE